MAEWGVVAGLIAWLVVDLKDFTMDAYPVETIRLEGLERLDSSDILSKLDTHQMPGMLSYPVREVAERVASHPGIKEVTVVQRMPSEVVFFVKERKPVAYATPQKRGTYFEIDGEGVVLNELEAGNLADLPIIWLPIPEEDEVRVGEEIPVSEVKKGLDFLEVFQRLGESWPTLVLLDARDGENLQIYFEGFEFPFWWGPEQFEDHVSGFELALSQLRQGLPVRHRVDLRFSLEEDPYFVKN